MGLRVVELTPKPLSSLSVLALPSDRTLSTRWVAVGSDLRTSLGRSGSCSGSSGPSSSSGSSGDSSGSSSSSGTTPSSTAFALRSILATIPSMPSGSST